MVPEVSVGEHESLDKALRRLKKKIEREGILKILKLVNITKNRVKSKGGNVVPQRNASLPIN